MFFTAEDTDLLLASCRPLLLEICAGGVECGRRGGGGGGERVGCADRNVYADI